MDFLYSTSFFGRNKEKSYCSVSFCSFKTRTDFSKADYGNFFFEDVLDIPLPHKTFSRNIMI